MGNISRAKITNGVWVRNVPWVHNRVWRTDIFKTVLYDPRLRVAEFHLKGGPIVRIPKEEMARVLVGVKDHYDKKIWGPFDIDPQTSTVNRQKVLMTIVS